MSGPVGRSHGRAWRAVFGWGGGLVLVAAHMDFWRTSDATLWFGWLPTELAYRLGWMALAWLYLTVFVGWVWTIERDPDGPGAPEGPA